MMQRWKNKGTLCWFRQFFCVQTLGSILQLAEKSWCAHMWRRLHKSLTFSLSLSSPISNFTCCYIKNEKKRTLPHLPSLPSLDPGQACSISFITIIIPERADVSRRFSLSLVLTCSNPAAPALRWTCRGERISIEDAAGCWPNLNSRGV